MTEDDERSEISFLLPWYAAGTLDPVSTRRVAAALEGDSELRQRLEIVREEAAETVFLNESIAAPPRRVADKLFAAIDAEQAVNGPARAPRFQFSEWLREKLASAHPRTLALAAAAVAAVLALQTALLVVDFGGSSRGQFETATAPAATATGGRLLVSFAPEATIADIEAVLRDAGARIVAGPQGGMYRLDLAGGQKSEEQVLRILRDRPQIVRFAGAGS